jgi:hypothetical protein
MRNFVLALCVVAISCNSIDAKDTSAVELVQDIYTSCVSQLSASCVKPKALAWLSHAVNQDKIEITKSLSIIRTGDDEFVAESRANANPIVNLFDQVDSFLSSHSLKIEKPEILEDEQVTANIPRSLLSGGIADGIEIPLVAGNAVEGLYDRRDTPSIVLNLFSFHSISSHFTRKN